MQIRCLHYIRILLQNILVNEWYSRRAVAIELQFSLNVPALYAIAEICILELRRCLIAVQLSNLYLSRIWFKCLAGKITLYADIEKSILSQFYLCGFSRYLQQNKSLINNNNNTISFKIATDQQRKLMFEQMLLICI